MSDIPVSCKISRGLPKTRGMQTMGSNFRIDPENRSFYAYPDRRIKGKVYTMASSEIRIININNHISISKTIIGQTHVHVMYLLSRPKSNYINYLSVSPSRTQITEKELIVSDTLSIHKWMNPATVASSEIVSI
jgi:hypothetical protein